MFIYHPVKNRKSHVFQTLIPDVQITNRLPRHAFPIMWNNKDNLIFELSTKKFKLKAKEKSIEAYNFVCRTKNCYICKSQNKISHVHESR